MIEPIPTGWDPGPKNIKATGENIVIQFESVWFRWCDDWIISCFTKNKYEKKYQLNSYC